MCFIGFFSPSSNAAVRIKGTYTEPGVPGGQASFKPSDPSALESLPKGVVEGYLTPGDAKGGTVTKGTVLNGGGSTILDFTADKQLQGGQGELRVKC